MENSLNIFIEGLLHLDISSFCFKFEAESSCMFGSLSAEAAVSPDVPLVWKQNTSLKSNKDVEILIYNGIWELKNDFFLRIFLFFKSILTDDCILIPRARCQLLVDW